MFKKKFNVRVRHFSKQFYQVEYTYHTFFPRYVSLKKWVNYGFEDNLEFWSTKLFTYDGAIKFAETLNSIDDVLNFIRKENEKRDLFYKSKNEYRLKNPIRETKYFK